MTTTTQVKFSISGGDIDLETCIEQSDNKLFLSSAQERRDAFLNANQTYSLPADFEDLSKLSKSNFPDISPPKHSALQRVFNSLPPQRSSSASSVPRIFINDNPTDIPQPPSFIKANSLDSCLPPDHSETKRQVRTSQSLDTDTNKLSLTRKLSSGSTGSNSSADSSSSRSSHGGNTKISCISKDLVYRSKNKPSDEPKRLIDVKSQMTAEDRRNAFMARSQQPVLRGIIKSSSTPRMIIECEKEEFFAPKEDTKKAVSFDIPDDAPVPMRETAPKLTPKSAMRKAATAPIIGFATRSSSSSANGNANGSDQSDSNPANVKKPKATRSSTVPVSICGIKLTVENKEKPRQEEEKGAEKGPAPKPRRRRAAPENGSTMDNVDNIVQTQEKSVSDDSNPGPLNSELVQVSSHNAVSTDNDKEELKVTGESVLESCQSFDIISSAPRESSAIVSVDESLEEKLIFAAVSTSLPKWEIFQNESDQKEANGEVIAETPEKDEVKVLTSKHSGDMCTEKNQNQEENNLREDIGIQKVQEEPAIQKSTIPTIVLQEFDDKNLKEADKDPNIPVGAPLFLEALQRHHPFLISESLTVDIHSGAISPVSPKQRSREKKKVTGGTGMKSPVMVSPGREHSMEVLIATKRGRPEFIPPGETVPDLDDPEARSRDRQKKAKEGVHRPEDDFQDKQDELEKIKKRVEMQRKMMDDLDKYRPKNIYKEEEDYGTEYDIDDSPWDSHYQIGPDTYLMASRGASFNSRVRDYRRELWGDGAPLVNQGYLGHRNRDITVRERRRYTDILREKQMNIDPKSSEKATSASKDPKANAVDRIKADIEKVAPTATKKNADGTFAPIFVRRLRDGYLLSNSLPAVFECTILSQPAAEVSWTKHGKQITNDDKHKIFQENGSYRLTIMDPSVYDLGEYSCVASNQYGQDKSSCRLVSGEAPNRPGRPDLQLSSDTELFFTFEPPEGPTYLEGIMYKVEYRLAGENDYGAPWVLISDKVDDEAVLIKHLEPLGIYQFRVTARNGFGWGEPSLNSRIVRTHPRGSPKLIMDELERTSRFCVVNMPQTKAGVQSLEEISEESEDTDEESLKKGIAEVQLQESSFSGRFNIQSLIYQTKHSVIRNAQDNQSEGGANCVVKIRHCAGDSEAQSLKEYELLKKSQHENVVNLIAAHRCDGFLHLFMERLYEDVFARFTFNDNYTEEQICIVGRQLSAALHWLHFNGIAHLDVTPQNVLFISKRSWVLKLTDFSSAQSVGPEAKVPSEPNVQWAPPEFYVESAPVTVQSDIWGMGVIVFCLLGGFHPFSSQFDTLDEVKENVINVKCDPNLIPVQASQEALSFVTWALKKSPIRRMRTDEALSHRFLSTDPSAVRRREAIRYPSSKLRKTAHLTKQSFETPTRELSHKYGTLSNGSM